MACNLIGQEIVFGFGKRDQADFATINADADFLVLETMSREPGIVAYQNSDNSQMTGKGREFASQVYKESALFTHEFEFIAGAEVMAWVAAMGLGSVIKSGSDPNFTYTAIPAVRGTDPCTVKPFSVVQQDTRSPKLLDQAFIGCGIAGWTLSVQSGPERANSRLRVRVLGTGREARPSGVTLPAATVPTDLLAANLALTALSVNYVSTARINSLELTWENSAIQRFFPGSGSQNGYGLAGSVEVTPGRGYSLSMNVDFKDMASELNKIRDGDEGSIVLELEASATRKVTVTLHRARFTSAAFSEGERGVNLDVQATGLWHATNGLVTIAALCGIDNVGAAPA